MLGYIYKTTNLINGKIYIGQHLSEKFVGSKYLGSGIILRKAIGKYGKENFKVELLVECNTQDELDYWEQYYINYENSMDKSIGYNITKGGFGGSAKMSSETKKKISDWNKDKTLVNDGEICFKIPKSELQEYLDMGYSFGPLPYTRTEEFKNKVRATNTGKIGVHKGDIKTWVKEEDLQKYLDMGYSLGWCDNRKTYEWKSIKGTGKYKMMFNGTKYLKVAESEWDRFLQDGWIFKGPPKKKKPVRKKGYRLSAEVCKKLSEIHKGKRHSKEIMDKVHKSVLGTKVVHKELCIKHIKPEDIETYLNDGWVLGRYGSKEYVDLLNSLWVEFKSIYDENINVMSSIMALTKIHPLYDDKFIFDIFKSKFECELMNCFKIQLQNELEHLQEDMSKEQALEKLKEVHCELLEKDLLTMLDNK